MPLSATSFFGAVGNLILWSEEGLPYVLLNALLMDADRLVERAKYLMIGVEPNISYGFKLSDDARLASSGSYRCIPEVSVPEGSLLLKLRICKREGV